MGDIHEQLAILGGEGHHDLDKRVITRLSRLLGLQRPLQFTKIKYGVFPDGEPDVLIDNPEEISGRHVIVMQTAYTAEFFDQFLALGWTAKNEHNAKSVTGVLNFMWFRRQENPRRHEINMARMAIGDMANDRFDNVIFCDIHSPIILEDAGKKGLRAYNADPSPLYADEIKASVLLARSEGVPFFIYSPDEGSIPRAVSLARELGLRVAFNAKNRKYSGEVEIIETDILERLQKQYPDVEIVEAGDNLNGAYVCMREDEVSTGTTAGLTGRRLIDDYGVAHASFCATHAVCTPGWQRSPFIVDTPFKQIFMGDTIDRGYKKSTAGIIQKVDVSPVIAAQLAGVVKRELGIK